MDHLILTVNTGSSSLKAALYDRQSSRTASLDITRIGEADARIRLSHESGRTEDRLQVSDHAAALDRMVQWLRDDGNERALLAIGHRVVHGGPQYSAPQEVSDALIEELRRLAPIDPMHLPQAIGAMWTLRKIFPALLQVACFDTAFHRTMSQVAQSYPIPRKYREKGAIRYGFHGLSYEYIMGRMREIDPEGAWGRVIIAHLGNGASMAAVRAGRSVDTTMGFTPTGGLVMGTRTGDLDPGLLLYFLQEQGTSAAELNELVNIRSGLLGLSGVTSDMQDLLRRRSESDSARLAINVFCYSARKHIGALAAVLGGLDTLVFTGGIGEHALEIREEICRDLEFIGVRLDPERNKARADIISSSDSTVTVRVLATDEDAMIAAHTLRVLQARGDSDVSV